MEGQSIEADSFVFVVCADAQIRGGLNARLKPLGLRRQVCKSADDFFDVVKPDSAGCVLLWLENAAADLELLKRMDDPKKHLPVVCISAHADMPMAVLAMKLGAIDFLDANCTDEQLSKAMHEAFCRHALRRKEIAYAAIARQRLSSLSEAHREVLKRIMSGLTNREIAQELTMSERGVEERRSKIMQTMQAKSLAELVRQVLAVENDGL
jgi:FixJ family two-component response regulator